MRIPTTVTILAFTWAGALAAPPRAAPTQSQPSRGRDRPPASQNDAAAVTSLAASLTPLRDHFNRHADRLRFVTLLSPT